MVNVDVTRFVSVLSLLISSSVFPENMEPQMTSMQPDFLILSEYILVDFSDANLVFFYLSCNRVLKTPS